MQSAWALIWAWIGPAGIPRLGKQPEPVGRAASGRCDVQGRILPPRLHGGLAGPQLSQRPAPVSSGWVGPTPTPSGWVELARRAWSAGVKVWAKGFGQASPSGLAPLAWATEVLRSTGKKGSHRRVYPREEAGFRVIYPLLCRPQGPREWTRLERGGRMRGGRG